MTNRYLNDDEKPAPKSKLAKDFDKFVKKNEAVREQIQAALSTASQALQMAMDLSNESGLPFETNISFIPNNYFPPSFGKTKYKELSADEIYNAIGVYNNNDYRRELGGFLHSDIC